MKAWQTTQSVYSFNPFLLSAHAVHSTVLGTGLTVKGKAAMCSPHGVHALGRGWGGAENKPLDM